MRPGPCLLLACLLLGVGRSWADDAVLHVRARARLEFAPLSWHEGQLVVSGKLIDAATGDGLGNRSVRLSLDRPDLGERWDVRTTEDGSFTRALGATTAATRVRVSFAGDEDCSAAPEQFEELGAAPEPSLSTGPDEPAPASRPSTSTEAAAPVPVPLVWYLAPPLATTILLLGASAARRLRGMRRVRPAPADVRPGPAPPSTAGIHYASRRPLLRRLTDHGLAGRVLDSADGRRLAGATVRLQGQTPELPSLAVYTGDDGSFAIEDLPPGSYRATVLAPGYLPQTLICTLPHHGELRGFGVGLASVRGEVLRRLEELAHHHLASDLGPPTAEGARTPREVLGSAARGRGGASPEISQLGPVLDEAQAIALGELVELVEEVYFSPRIPEPGVIDSVHHLAERVRRSAATSPPETSTLRR